MTSEKGRNGQRQEERRRRRRKEEEDDDEDDEESSCSRIAYRSVSPKATEPLILIIGYSLDSSRVPRGATASWQRPYIGTYSRTCPLPFFPFNSAYLDIRSLYLRLYSIGRGFRDDGYNVRGG